MRRTLVLAFAVALAACGKAQDPSAAPERFVATGAEPFFRLERDADGFRLSQPDYPDLTAPPVPGRVAEGGWAYETAAYQVIVLERDCTTSAGTTLPYAVDVLLTAQGVAQLGESAPDVLAGCGEKT